MEKIKFLIFDISSEYGFFGKYNSTTSPITYPFPPRTAVIGMIGAVLGFNRFEYVEKLSKNNALVAVQLINNIKKQNMGFNLINTKESFSKIKNRTQIGFELLKNPKFRIFIHIFNEEYFTDLVKKIESGKTHYTPYMGLTQFTAKTEFVDLAESRLFENNQNVKIISTIPLNKCNVENPLNFDYSSKYILSSMPAEMQVDNQMERICKEYYEVIVESEGKEIEANVKEYYEIGKLGKIVCL